MAKDFSRKDLKKQDQFLSRSTQIANWALQRRKTIGLALLLVVTAVSVLIAVRSYRQRQEQNAAAMLAVALEVYDSPVTVEDSPEGQVAPADEHAVGGHRHFTTQQAKYEAVVEALQPIVNEYGSYPSGRAAAFYQGVSLAGLDRLEDAETALEAAAAAGSPIIRGTALLRLGELYVGDGRFEEAIAVFDRLASDPPASFPVEEALLAKARAFEAAGDSQAALIAYQRIAEQHGDSVYAAPARERAEELAAILGVDLDAES